MNIKPWHDAQLMTDLYTSGSYSSDEEVTNHFNNTGWPVSRRTITDARNSLGIPALSKTELFDIESNEINESSNKDEIWSLAFKLQQELRKEKYAATDAKINLTDNKPIGIFFMGDLHIGDIGSDHQALLRDVKLIQQTEGLYGTLGGDYINNFIKNSKKIKSNEILPIEFAWLLAEDLFERLKESLWMVLLGNHDEWTETMAEIDNLGQMIKRLGVPYGKHGANLHINFPDGLSYKIRLRHKYRFESSMNILNAVKQMYRWDQSFDIGVLHHLHQPGIEAFMAPERGQCWAVRPGSYKVEDDFSFAMGYTSSGLGQSKTFGTENSCKHSVPVAILYPGSRRIQFATNIEEGIEYLQFARETYRSK